MKKASLHVLSSAASLWFYKLRKITAFSKISQRQCMSYQLNLALKQKGGDANVVLQLSTLRLSLAS
jgi:uncharacterized Zn finger protein